MYSSSSRSLSSFELVKRVSNSLINLFLKSYFILFLDSVVESHVIDFIFLLHSLLILQNRVLLSINVLSLTLLSRTQLFLTRL